MASALGKPPIVIGRYTLFDVIASGGMASVHIGRLLGPVAFARTVAIKRMHPQFAADPAFVARCHARGLAVLAWTVDDLSLMRRLLAMGVDGLTSNHPDLFARVESAEDGIV